MNYLIYKSLINLDKIIIQKLEKLGAIIPKDIEPYIYVYIKENEDPQKFLKVHPLLKSLNSVVSSEQLKRYLTTAEGNTTYSPQQGDIVKYPPYRNLPLTVEKVFKDKLLTSVVIRSRKYKVTVPNKVEKHPDPQKYNYESQVTGKFVGTILFDFDHMHNSSVGGLEGIIYQFYRVKLQYPHHKVTLYKGKSPLFDEFIKIYPLPYIIKLAYEDYDFFVSDKRYFSQYFKKVIHLDGDVPPAYTLMKEILPNRHINEASFRRYKIADPDLLAQDYPQYKKEIKALTKIAKTSKIINRVNLYSDQPDMEYTVNFNIDEKKFKRAGLHSLLENIEFITRTILY